MQKSYIYKCPKTCPINKRCFIIKTVFPISDQIKILQKCIAKKQDIEITIGGNSRPP